MSEYETVTESVKDFGKRSYLEVARKRVTDGDFETEFLVITRGFYDRRGGKRWTKFVTLPDDGELRSFLREALGEA